MDIITIQQVEKTEWNLLWEKWNYSTSPYLNSYYCSISIFGLVIRLKPENIILFLFWCQKQAFKFKWFTRLHSFIFIVILLFYVERQMIALWIPRIISTLQEFLSALERNTSSNVITSLSDSYFKSRFVRHKQVLSWRTASIIWQLHGKNVWKDSL